MDSLALHLRRPTPLHPRSGPSNFLYALLSPSSRLRCSSVVTLPTPTYGASAACVAEVTDYRLSPLRRSGLTPRQGESRGSGGSITSSSFVMVSLASSHAAIKLLRHVSHQFLRAAPPDPAVIICHHQSFGHRLMGGDIICGDRPTARGSLALVSYFQATFLPYSRSNHGGSSHGGSIFPSLNHGGLNGDRSSRGTGPFITVKCWHWLVNQRKRMWSGFFHPPMMGGVSCVVHR